MHADRKAYEFFRCFSRFEYALKASGYAKEGDKITDVEADWYKFCDRNSDRIENSFNSKELSRYIDYMTLSPPKKHKIVGGEFCWVHVECNEGTKQKNIFCYVKRVRNNLFHGSKFFDKWYADTRTVELIDASIHIIKAMVPLDPTLKKKFEDYGPEER